MALKAEGNYWKPYDNTVQSVDNSADVIIGDKSSTAYGGEWGHTLTATKPQNLLVCGDDGNAALSAIAYRNLWARMLLLSAQSGDVSIFGIQGQLKNTGVDTSTANKAGVWAYYEAVSGATVATNSAALMASIDVPSGATIGAGTVSAIQTGGDLGGTHTGKAAVLNIVNPSAGTWDYCISFGSATGAVAANTANLGSNTLTNVLKVRVGNTDGYIPILAAAPT
jgi:hypothetical protein